MYRYREDTFFKVPQEESICIWSRPMRFDIHGSRTGRDSLSPDRLDHG